MSGVYLDFDDDKLTSDPTRMTDAEMNAAVAVEVMGAGWLERRIVLNDGKPGWSPATDIAAAMNDVVGEMCRRGWTVSIETHPGANPYVVVRRPRQAWPPGHVRNESLPRAICEAVVAAVRSET